MQENERIVREFIQAWSRLDPAELASYFADDGVYHNMPTGPVAGRENVEKLIRGARLVTVTGVGGAGKTRLSLQVAAVLSEEYADGVWLVELAAAHPIDVQEDHEPITVFAPDELAMFAKRLAQSAVEAHRHGDSVGVHQPHEVVQCLRRTMQPPQWMASLNSLTSSGKSLP